MPKPKTSGKPAPKKADRPTPPIKQDAVSQAEILVLLDWLDKLSEAVDWNSYVRGRLEIGYKVVDTYFRTHPDK